MRTPAAFKVIPLSTPHHPDKYAQISPPPRRAAGSALSLSHKHQTSSSFANLRSKTAKEEAQMAHIMGCEGRPRTIGKFLSEVRKAICFLIIYSAATESVALEADQCYCSCLGC